MRKKLIVATLLLCLCLPMLLSGCLAVATYSLVIENNSYKIEEDYDSIKIDTVTANVIFIHSANLESRVFCEELRGQNHTVEVIDGTLTITQQKNDKWYNKVLNYTQSHIIVYLDNLQYEKLTFDCVNGDIEMQKGFLFNDVNVETKKGDIKWMSDVTNNLSIKLENGDIKLEDSSFNLLNVNSSKGDVHLINCSSSNQAIITITTGDLTLYNTELNTLNVNMDDGYVAFTNVSALSQIMINVTNGSISLYDCDAERVDITTIVGDITAKFLTEKRVNAQTNSGTIKQPDTYKGGICNVKTTNGNIIIEIATPKE